MATSLPAVTGFETCGNTPGRLQAVGVLPCRSSTPRLFAPQYAAPGSTRHSSRPPDRHKRQDSKSNVRDLFSPAAALTGVTVQLFSAHAPICKPRSVLYKPAPGSKRFHSKALLFTHTIVWSWWQAGGRVT